MNDQARREEEAKMQAERIAVVEASRALVESSRQLRGEAARLMSELDLESASAASSTDVPAAESDPSPPAPWGDDQLDEARRELHAAVDAVADGAAKIKKHLGRTD